MSIDDILKGKIKISFTLDPSEWHGSVSERLWAEKVAVGRDNFLFRLLNSPFFAKGVSFEDIVSVKLNSENKSLDFVQCTERGGHSTYRILIPKGSASFEKYWKPLSTIGCSYESTTFGDDDLYSVDIPTTTDVSEAFKLLVAGENDGVWTFEEAHCGHVLSQENRPQ